MGGKNSGGKTRFKKGSCPNPGGRPKLDPEIKAIRQLTKDQFKELANLLLSGTFEDLQRILDKQETTALTGWMVRVIVQGWEKGDYRTLDELLDRLIGKVPNELEVRELKPFVASFKNERIEMGMKEEDK